MMDKSEQYIKMCKKAKEIQELWNHNRRSDGDFYYHNILNNVYTATMHDQDGGECFWLPRQDQLQKIIIHKFEVYKDSIYEMEQSFASFIRCPPIRHNKDHEMWFNVFGQFTTLEQLWLVFVMKQEYDKVWRDGDWVES